MKLNAFQLTPGHRRWLYVVASILFLSGALWWMADTAVNKTWSGNGVARAAKPGLLKIHGGAAMVFLVVLGTLWPNHIRRAWKAGRNRVSGAALICWLGFLAATGYGLYYFGDESLREWTATLHNILGLGAAVVLLGHIQLGRRSRLSATSAS